jgi:TetR/AcrR family transcriptional regulator, transcriptional repressor of bet genes
MPKQVDRLARRRDIAEAVFRLSGARGAEVVSLRDVAAEAGVSLGMVQHYFRSKDEMLLFALEHMHDRAAGRLKARLGSLASPGPRDVIRALLAVLLPVDQDTRAEAAISVAFYSRAAVTPAYAAALRDGLANLLDVVTGQLRTAQHGGHLRPGLDAGQEAEALFWLAHGLVGPLLVGFCTPEAAWSLLDRHLDRILD